MDVTAWLLDGDPAIRWQTRLDLLDDEEGAAADRALVESEGWGARLLDLQHEDGTWGHGVWTQRDWVGVDDALLLLALLGARGPRTAAAVDRVVAHVDWGAQWWHHPFFDGEVEPCINGRVLVAGSAFGHPSELIVERLIAEQQDDGGWNCYAQTRADPGSFHSTICALEGLTAYRYAGGPTEVAAAIDRGHGYLLERGLLRRKRDGALIDPSWSAAAFPPYWRYDVLRGLDHLRAAGVRPDARLDEALDAVAAARGTDGRWRLDRVHPGETLVTMEREGEPSRWNTLRALRVLRWAGR
ncbi:hypothetical protein [uncultured Leifsonia sp.]|uniref:hypothetical protein n=1 Tax=uncultured Leifsonia sp. TaxID=340359 RepID=UPI0028D23CB2|nr:hypothetical protein [uncultured Leifsonia sp.]